MQSEKIFLETQIMECTFHFTLNYIKTPIPYTSVFSAILKTEQGELISIESNKPKLLNAVALFNQEYYIKTQLIFGSKEKCLSKKQFFIWIFGSPENKPDLARSFGKIIVNFTQVVKGQYENEKDYKLEGDVKNMSVNLKGKMVGFLKTELKEEGVEIETLKQYSVQLQSSIELVRRQLFPPSSLKPSSNNKKQRDTHNNNRQQDSKGTMRSSLSPVDQARADKSLERAHKILKVIQQEKQIQSSGKKQKQLQRRSVQKQACNNYIDASSSKNQSQLQYINHINEQLKQIHLKFQEERILNQKVKSESTSLKDINQNLKFQISSLREENSILKRNCEELQHYTDQLLMTLNIKDNDLHLTKNELDSVRQKNISLAKKASYFQNFQAEREELILQMDDLKQIVQSLKFTHSENELKQIQMKATIKNLKGELNEMEFNSHLLSQQIKEDDKEIKGLKDKLLLQSQRYENCLKVMKEADEDAKENIERVDAELKSLREQIGKWEQGYEEQAAKIERYRQQLKQQKVKCESHALQEQALREEYEAKVEALREKDNIMKKNLQIVQEETNQVIESLQEKEENQEKLLQILIDKDRQINEITESKDRFEKLLSLERERSLNLERQISITISNRGGSFGLAEDDQRQKMIQKNASLLSLLHNNVTKLVDYEKIKKQNGHLHRQCEQRSKKLKEREHQLKDLKEKVTSLMIQNKKLIQGNNKLGKDINTKTQLLNKYRQEIISLKNQNLELSEIVGQKQFYIEKLKKQIAESKGSNGINRLSRSECKTLAVPKLDDAQSLDLSSRSDEAPTKNANEFRLICKELENLIKKRISGEQFEPVLQILLRKTSSQDQGQMIYRDIILLQEKTRKLSMELQTLKSSVFKFKSKSMSERSQLAGLLQPCERTVRDLIQLCEGMMIQSHADSLAQSVEE